MSTLFGIEATTYEDWRKAQGAPEPLTLEKIERSLRKTYWSLPPHLQKAFAELFPKIKFTELP